MRRLDLSASFLNGSIRFKTLDVHTEGESLRIISAEYPQTPGQTMLVKRRYVREHLDRYRSLLMHESRGTCRYIWCVDQRTCDWLGGLLGDCFCTTKVKGERLKIESIVGGAMIVREETLVFQGKQAVLPEVSGGTFITGRDEFIRDPNDPF